MPSEASSTSRRCDTALRFQGPKMPPLTLPSGRLSKESLSERVRAIKEAHPEAEVELWAEDEARLGLKPVMRRVWAPVGQRPTAPGSQAGIGVDLPLGLCTTHNRRGLLADLAHRQQRVVL